MADEITLPGGLKVKRNVAMIIGVAAVGIGGYFYYRQRKANAAAASTSAAAATGSQIDPQTGYAYGSPEDQAALAAMAGGTLGQYNSAGYVGGQVTGYDQYGNPIYSPGGSGNPPGPGSYTSNAQWTQAAEQLMGSNGADAIAAALGKYLLKAPLTPDQITVVQEAIAGEGFPPVPGSDGYPPSYHTLTNPTPPGAVTAKNPVKGIVLTPGTTEITVHWQPLANATSYQVVARRGIVEAARETATGPAATMHNLQRHTQYRVSVWGQPGSGSRAHATATTL